MEKKIIKTWKLLRDKNPACKPEQIIKMVQEECNVGYTEVLGVITKEVEKILEP